MLLALSGQVSALCFALKHSWMLLVQCYRLAYCDGIYCAPQTLRGFVVPEDIHISHSPAPPSLPDRDGERKEAHKLCPKKLVSAYLGAPSIVRKCSVTLYPLKLSGAMLQYVVFALIMSIGFQGSISSAVSLCVCVVSC